MQQNSIKKTNAARLLDSLGVPYSLRSVLVDENDLSAIKMAEDLGTVAENVYKTLVARGDRHGVFMACIMAHASLDLKKMAKVTQNKNVEMVSLKEVLPLTGYVRGGCSPLAAKKNYPVFIDEHAILQEKIYVNAGQRGLQIFIKPDDLIMATQGQFADIIK